MPAKRCEACDAELVWAKTRNNRWIPLDRASLRKVTIVDRYFGDGTPMAEVVDGYTVHFETCPDADRFRKTAQPPGIPTESAEARA